MDLASGVSESAIPFLNKKKSSHALSTVNSAGRWPGHSRAQRRPYSFEAIQRRSSHRPAATYLADYLHVPTMIAKPERRTSSRASEISVSRASPESGRSGLVRCKELRSE